MIILDVNKLSKSFGFGELFKNVSFSLNEGETISIVGPNGCGKSTLLKLITGEQRADGGSVFIKKGVKVAYLDQVSADKVDDRKVIDILKDAFTELNNMNATLKYYENLMQNPAEDYDKTLEKYCKLVEEFSRLGGYDVDVEIGAVCSGLNIKKELFNRNYTSLSGGEKTLIQLAKALLQKPDLLLLDEPTNHLDIERIEWLESYIKSFKGACVIVSHDRYFLDKMSNKILDLTNVEPKIYNTNYTGYLKERERDFEKQLSAYKDQQLVIKRLREQIKYFSEMGMAKDSPTLLNRAKAMQTQLSRILDNKIEKPIEPRKIRLAFDREKKSSKRVFETKNLTVFTPDGRKILNGINFIITQGKRVALIGANGSGKTTFLKTLLGTQELRHEGEVIIGPSVKIGYLPQIISFENDKFTILNYFKDEASVGEEQARRILASFQFYKDDVDKKVKNLSGGERIRLRLAVLLQQKLNCLVFDEPTNHIDISTKEVLEKALNDFSGTILFVSHDRYFINKLADKVVEFKNGTTTTYLGNYDFYRSEKSKK